MDAKTTNPRKVAITGQVVAEVRRGFTGGREACVDIRTARRATSDDKGDRGERHATLRQGLDQHLSRTGTQRRDQESEMWGVTEAAPGEAAFA